MNEENDADLIGSNMLNDELQRVEDFFNRHEQHRTFAGIVVSRSEHGSTPFAICFKRKSLRSRMVESNSPETKSMRKNDWGFFYNILEDAPLDNWEYWRSADVLIKSRIASGVEELYRKMLKNKKEQMVAAEAAIKKLAEFLRQVDPM